MSFCACGQPYYPESTGEGPCHKSCEVCGELILDDNNHIASEYNLCTQCMSESLQDSAKMAEFIEFGRKLIDRNNKWEYVKKDIMALFDIFDTFNK